MTKTTAISSDRSPGARSTAISRARRQSGEKSLLAFMQAYFPSYCTARFSRMHEEAAALLEHASEERGARLAIAAPRGHAKSTLVTLAYVLWSVCYQKEPYIVVLSNTGEQARALLANIKRELESNSRLREDFPQACSIPPHASKPKTWRRHEIVTASNAMITAQGSGSQIRGRRHSQNRPTLIICDDLESQVSVRSAEQRRVLEEWFTSTVLKLGTGQTNVVVVGTILHYDSLLARLTSNRPGAMPGWSKHVYQAIEAESSHPELWDRFENLYNGNEADPGGKTGPAAARAFYHDHSSAMMTGVVVLWPEREDYLALNEMRIREGRASFSAEKQNAPLSPEDAIFRPDEIVYWDDRFAEETALLASFEESATFVGACDPSLGKAGRNRDDTAIVTLVRDNKSGRMFVVDADIRKRKPADIIDAVIAYHGRRGYRLFGMESVQFQEFVATELQERSRAAGDEVPVQEIRQVKDKLGRVQRLQPLVASGGIQFSRRHARLMEQLEQFPMGAHDDGPDALEMAVTIAQSLSSSVWAEVISSGVSDDAAEDDRMWTRVWPTPGW